MFTIYYDPEDNSGLHYGDGQIESAVTAFLSYPNLTITTNQELLIDAFRVAIKQGRLDPDNFQVNYGDKIVRFDIHGRYLNEEWDSVASKLLMELV